MLRFHGPVGEVAASAAGDQYFLPDTVRMIQKEDFAPPLARGQRAHQPCPACADDDHIKLFRDMHR